jgi:hypothetical protein
MHLNTEGRIFFASSPWAVPIKAVVNVSNE